MTTLKDAWSWYEATWATLRLAERLAETYWDDLPWDGPMGRDQVLRDVIGSDAFRRAQAAERPLDDLAVLVLFSAFESLIRGVVRDQVAIEAGGLRHPALTHA